MKDLNLFSVACIILVLAIAAPASAEDTDSEFGTAYKPLTCVAIDSSLIDLELPVPIVVVPDTLFSNTTRNLITWQRPLDDGRVFRYHIEASLTPSFDVIEDCVETEKTDTGVYFTMMIEDTIWYRVRSADSGWLHFSAPSDSISIIQDTTHPVLDSIVARRAGMTGDGRAVVRVDYFGYDLYPAWLLLGESPNLTTCDTIPIDQSTGTVLLTLSAQEERKQVYGRMIDKAGNVSDTVSTEVMVATTSHSYPNPFNPRREAANLVFNLSRSCAVDVLIYDLFGNLVYERTGISCTAGINDGRDKDALRWSGKNMNDEIVADGGYVCVIKAGDDKFIHKIAVVK